MTSTPTQILTRNNNPKGSFADRWMSLFFFCFVQLCLYSYANYKVPNLILTSKPSLSGYIWMTCVKEQWLEFQKLCFLCLFETLSSVVQDFINEMNALKHWFLHSAVLTTGSFYIGTFRSCWLYLL